MLDTPPLGAGRKVRSFLSCDGSRRMTRSVNRRRPARLGVAKAAVAGNRMRAAGRRPRRRAVNGVPSCLRGAMRQKERRLGRARHGGPPSASRVRTCGTLRLPASPGSLRPETPLLPPVVAHPRHRFWKWGQSRRRRDRWRSVFAQRAHFALDKIGELFQLRETELFERCNRRMS